MKISRTQFGMRCVRGVLNVQLSEMTVLTIQQMSIRIVNKRYLANSGRLFEDGGRRLVTKTYTAQIVNFTTRKQVAQLGTARARRF